MMKLIKSKFPLTLLCLFLICSVKLKAQVNQAFKSKFERATQAFQSLQYAEAIVLLNDLVKKDSVHLKTQEMLAYSYRMVKNYPQALKWYEKLTRQQSVKPEWALYYAEALASNQQYERSEGWYRKYLILTPADKRAAVFARNTIERFNTNIGNWKIGFTNLNTDNAEYAPAFYKDGLMFSSNRPSASLTKPVFLWDRTPFTNLYMISKRQDVKVIDKNTLKANASNKSAKSAYKFNDDDTAPTSNDTRILGAYNMAIREDTVGPLLADSITPLLLGGKVNTKYHEAAPAVFPDGSIMFTRNNYLNGHKQTSKNGINKLKLYTATGNDLSKISEFPYNSNEYSTGHPTLNKAGNILIFASDMPGGYGGTDLYYSVRSGNGQWTRPVNLGKQINTEGNEMFPFLDTENTLYFASTGHAGLGGLDVFEVALKEMRPVTAPKNMGVPINSPKDDFSLIKSEDGKLGYFSSNRRGNDDIYEFKRAFQLIVFQGVVTDARTRIPLAGSKIFMRHQNGIDTLTTNAKGEYRRELPLETDYALTTVKNGYVNEIGYVSSQGITQDSVIRMDVRLNRTETQQQYVLNNCDSLKRVFAVKNIYYDLDRAEIRNDARPALEELARLMKKFPAISIITSSHCDSRASFDYNKSLSLRRGEAAKAFLVARGISANRIRVAYYGQTRLVNRCFDGVPCSEADQQLNRRTEFDVILNGVNLTQLECDD